MCVVQYHFWMSTFTVIHHTAPHIPFKPAATWNVCPASLHPLSADYSQYACNLLYTSACFS